MSRWPSLLRSPNCAPKLQPPRSTPIAVAMFSNFGRPFSTPLGTHRLLPWSRMPSSEMFET
jgi:hypothetical protein